MKYLSRSVFIKNEVKVRIAVDFGTEPFATTKNTYRTLGSARQRLRGAGVALTRPGKPMRVRRIEKTIDIFFSLHVPIMPDLGLDLECQSVE